VTKARSHVYIVEAITPVRIANIIRTPPGGRIRVSTKRRNHSSPSGIKKEKIVWPIRLQLQ
jgi:hypothetical protein